METKKPVHVKAYTRNKKPTTNQSTDQNTTAATMLIVGIVGLFVIVYWQFFLAVAVIVAAGILAKIKAREFLSQPQYVINYYWRNRIAERFIVLRGLATRLG